MDRLARCIVYEPQPCWAPRLKAVARSSAELTEVRIASEVDKLLSEESRRLLLIALRQSMSAAQCATRLRKVAETRDRWPHCQVLLLLDERMEAWHQASWEIGGGLVFVGNRSLTSLAKTVDRLISELPTEDETAHRHDPLEWLPW